MHWIADSQVGVSWTTNTIAAIAFPLKVAVLGWVCQPRIQRSRHQEFLRFGFEDDPEEFDSMASWWNFRAMIFFTE